MDIEKQLELAERIARQRHMGQADKGGHPYIGHPRRVAALVSTPLEKTVAWLHDTVEDTGYSADMMRADGFDERVIEAVMLLTHRPHEPYMDYVRRLADNPVARRVKLADLNDNMDLARLPDKERDSEATRRRMRKYREAAEYLSSIGETDGNRLFYVSAADNILDFASMDADTGFDRNPDIAYSLGFEAGVRYAVEMMTDD